MRVFPAACLIAFGCLGFFAGPTLTVEITRAATSNLPALAVNTFPSGSSGTQSFLRFYNAGTAPGTVHIVLTNFLTGQTLATWDSPIIAAGAAPQIAMRDIEAQATPSFTKPPFYLLSIQTAMSGTFAHVGWDASNGTLTNLSTCDQGVTAIHGRVANVHSSLLAGEYASSIDVVNTGKTTAAVSFGIFDARDGVRLGTYTSRAVAPGAGVTLTMSEMEAAINIRPSAGMYHYVLKTEGFPAGPVQHIVRNSHAAVVTDMTTVCALPGS